MSRLKTAWKKAFAVDPSGPAQPTEQQSVVVDRLCREIARRHLTTPALIFLEMSRPLNYIGSQVMHFFQPIIAVVTDTAGYEQFAKFLERRGSIEYICRRIEYFEHQLQQGPDQQPTPQTNQPPTSNNEPPTTNHEQIITKDFPQ